MSDPRNSLTAPSARTASRPSSRAQPEPQTHHRIDTHHHIYPPLFTKHNIDRLLADAQWLPAAAYLEWTPQVALEEMDRNGVATAITSITSPGIWAGDTAAARRWAQECNEFGARMVADFGHRFGMFAAVPLPDIEGSLAAIAHALDTLRLDGIGLMTSYDGKLLGDPAFAPVFDELNRRKSVVFVHPTTNSCCGRLNPLLDTPLLEFPFDTARTISSLLLSGTTARCPDIRFLFCHGGGPLAMLAGRIESVVRRYPEEKRRALFPHGFAAEIRKLHYDVVSVAAPGPMAALRQLVPITQLTLGSDFPFGSAATTIAGLETLALPAAERRAIERDNALRLFPRLAKIE